jgi:SET domain-containing protein
VEETKYIHMVVPKTSVRPSGIHGLGLFAEEEIPAGGVVWRFHPAVDIPMDESLWSDLPTHVRNRLLRGSWVSRGGVRWGSLDDDCRMNHSDEPNIRMEGDTMVAARDIEVGEEITCRYGDFHQGDPWEGS